MKQKLFDSAIVLTIMLVIVGISYASNEDFKQEVKNQIMYRKSVEQNLHPDYENTFEKLCTEEKMKGYEKNSCKAVNF